jgi:hypothetical protein
MFRSGSSEWQGAQARKSCWPRKASPGSASAGDDNAIAESAMIANLFIADLPGAIL